MGFYKNINQKFSNNVSKLVFNIKILQLILTGIGFNFKHNDT